MRTEEGSKKTILIETKSSRYTLPNQFLIDGATDTWMVQLWIWTHLKIYLNGWLSIKMNWKKIINLII